MQEVTRLKNIFIFNHIESFLEGKCCGLQVVTRPYCRVIYDHSCIGLNQLYNPRGLWRFISAVSSFAPYFVDSYIHTDCSSTSQSLLCFFPSFCRTSFFSVFYFSLNLLVKLDRPFEGKLSQSFLTLMWLGAISRFSLSDHPDSQQSGRFMVLIAKTFRAFTPNLVLVYF